VTVSPKRSDPVARVQELKVVCRAAQARTRQLVARGNLARQRRVELGKQRGELSNQMEDRRAVLYTDGSRAGAALLEAVFRVSGMSLMDLWLEYFALAGDLTPEELEAVLAGRAPLYRADERRLACILS
jgi:hypothetical protein